MLSLWPLAVTYLIPGSSPHLRAPAITRPRTSSPLLETAELAEPKLETSTGFDFVPLMTALKAQDFLEADQLTRDGLIMLAGEAAQKRGYVYFSEVPKLPTEDLATIERLWNTYSEGKFGYSIQKEIFNSKKCAGVLERMYERIGWVNEDGNLLRWLPDKVCGCPHFGVMLAC